MNQYDMKQSADTLSKLAKMIDDNEKISLISFVYKLGQAAEAYPEDYTIGALAEVIARMSDSKSFINRAELKSLYNKFYSRNTKFASVFENELGVVAKEEKTIQPKTTNDLNITEETYKALVDPVLAHALNIAFGNTTKAYVEEFGNKAKIICETKLAACGIKAKKIEVACGGNDVLVCSAQFETPKGNTSVLIPVEVLDNKVLLPSVFVSNAGSEELNKATLVKYVSENAGKPLAIRAELVLAASQNAKNADKISNVDLALTKLNASKEQGADWSQGQVLYQKVEAEKKDIEVKTPKFEDAEITLFAKQFDSALGTAQFQFGNITVKIARDLVANYMTNFGFRNSQVVVADCNENSIVCAVSLNNAAFTVPVKIENGRALPPTVLLANGGIEDFTATTVNKLVAGNMIDTKAAAMASTLFDMRASELVEIVRVAMTGKNFAKAEEALNVLAEGNDPKAYKAAFEVYSAGLSSKEMIASKCSMIVRNSSSQHDICGHTGLPLHKVYQDKNGNCCANHRKAIDESYDGATFMNNKVLI